MNEFGAVNFAVLVHMIRDAPLDIYLGVGGCVCVWGGGG